MTNFAALMGALVKRGSWAGPTLTAKTAELGARVRFTGGALGGQEGTVIGAYGGNVVSVRLDSGHVKPKVPMERCQLVGKLDPVELQKLRERLAASAPAVASYSSVPGGTHVVVQPPASGWNGPVTVSVAGHATAGGQGVKDMGIDPSERPPSKPPPPKKKAPPLKRKADWDF